MRTWVKLYTEILLDPKMHALSDRDHRACINLFALAGIVDDRGRLGTTDDIAFHLRYEPDEAARTCEKLAEVGIVKARKGIWWLVNFEKRQAKPPSGSREAVRERVTKHRENKAKPRTDADKRNEPVTTLHDECNEPVTRLEQRREDTDTEKKREEEKANGAKPAPPAPATEAGQAYFQIFNRKRWANPEQREFFEQTERDVGSGVMREAIKWAARKGIADVNTVCTAARNWGKREAARKNGKPAIPESDELATDEQVHAEYLRLNPHRRPKDVTP